MIVRFTSEKTGKWRDIDSDSRDYTAAILDLCGGGYTEDQTANAMETMAEIREGNTCVRGGFTIQRVGGARLYEECQLCSRTFTEPEDGPLYCGACKHTHPEQTRSGIDTDTTEHER